MIIKLIRKQILYILDKFFFHFDFNMAAKNTPDQPSKGKFQSTGSFFRTIYLDKISRSSSKTNHELEHQASRENSQITCFFKACDREASEKLLQDAYTYSISPISYYFTFLFSSLI
jgi:hypothetical protein